MSLERIASELADQHQMHAREVYRLLMDAMRRIEAQTVAEGRCAIRGLGVFRLQTMAPRMGRNPKTGETVMVPQHHRVVFRQASDRRRAVQDLLERDVNGAASNELRTPPLPEASPTTPETT